LFQSSLCFVFFCFLLFPQLYYAYALLFRYKFSFSNSRSSVSPFGLSASAACTRRGLVFPSWSLIRLVAGGRAKKKRKNGEEIKPGGLGQLMLSGAHQH